MLSVKLLSALQLLRDNERFKLLLVLLFLKVSIHSMYISSFSKLAVSPFGYASRPCPFPYLCWPHVGHPGSPAEADDVEVDGPAVCGVPPGLDLDVVVNPGPSGTPFAPDS